MEVKEKIDIEHRITEVEQRAKGNTRRIEKLENLTDAIHEMATTMAHLVEQTKSTNENVEELKVKVDAIEKEPLQNYKQFKKTVITAVITAIVSALVGGLIGFFI